MTGGSISELAAGSGAQKQRAAYFEDYAKPVLVNWPFMLVAAATLFIVGHFANRGSGRRLGGDSKKRSPPTQDASNRSTSSKGRGDGNLGCRGNQPLSLAELRTLRAEAAEARLKHGASTSNGPGVAKLTPLGSILLLARKVDQLEEKASMFLGTVKEGHKLDPKGEQEHARLLELLTQVQLEIDGVQSDESVRPHRKTQTNRVQRLILDLEGTNKQTN